MEPSKKKIPKILVIDYGSQYSLLITRRLRELGHFSELIDSSDECPPIQNIAGVILSGGPDSTNQEGARRLPKWLDLNKQPILGICYGIHLLAREFGGTIRNSNLREYGKEEIILEDLATDTLFQGCDKIFDAWMSHGDDIQDYGTKLEVLARSDSGAIAAIKHKSLPIYGLQYHPEVAHSSFGSTVLKNFCETICHLEADWSASTILTNLSRDLQTNLGPKDRVLMAVSGGVDSTVAAKLLVHALGPERVTTVFVDHGLLRKNEGDWVSEQFKSLGIKNFVKLNKENIFLEALAGIDDPETKRKTIGRLFIETFENFAKEHDGEFSHLGQGTLYPDVIESAGHGAGSKVIKSHHNVGGLPERLALKLCEPFRFLFKDEVRALGRELGISDSFVDRHPFPGPGLAIRILGAVSKPDLDLLREVDDVFIEELKKNKLYDEVWQAFAVLLPVKSVGVMGDNRTYERVVALRAVAASDGMTAGVSMLPLEFLTSVASKIVRTVQGVNRVVYDLTSKPPGTIEWE